LHIGYTNGKQLQKRLRQFEITPQQFADALTQLNQEEDHA
jgi:ribonuclease M5